MASPAMQDAAAGGPREEGAAEGPEEAPEVWVEGKGWVRARRRGVDESRGRATGGCACIFSMSLSTVKVSLYPGAA